MLLRSPGQQPPLLPFLVHDRDQALLPSERERPAQGGNQRVLEAGRGLHEDRQAEVERTPEEGGREEEVGQRLPGNRLEGCCAGC